MPRILIMNAGTAQMSGSDLATTQLSLASKSAWSPYGLHRREIGGPDSGFGKSRTRRLVSLDARAV